MLSFSWLGILWGTKNKRVRAVAFQRASTQRNKAPGRRLVDGDRSRPTGTDWTGEDQATAETQDWNVSEQEDGNLAIGAEQDAPVFADDVEVSAFVWHCADRGGQLALKAIGFILAHKFVRAAWRKLRRLSRARCAMTRHSAASNCLILCRPHIGSARGA